MLLEIQIGAIKKAKAEQTTDASAATKQLTNKEDPGSCLKRKEQDNIDSNSKRPRR